MHQLKADIVVEEGVKLRFREGFAYVLCKLLRFGS